MSLRLQRELLWRERLPPRRRRRKRQEGGPQILLPGLNGRLANVRVRGGENECAQT